MLTATFIDLTASYVLTEDLSKIKQLKLTCKHRFLKQVLVEHFKICLNITHYKRGPQWSSFTCQILLQSGRFVKIQTIV